MILVTVLQAVSSRVPSSFEQHISAGQPRFMWCMGSQRALKRPTGRLIHP